MTIGERLAKLRELAKMDQGELARAVGVKRATISSWETDRRVPSRKYLFELANLFRVSVEYILGFGREGAKPSGTDALPGDGHVSGVVPLPVYGSVGPGTGGLSRNRIVGQEVVAVDEVRDGHYFFFRVSGNAMEGDIKDGYVAFIKEGGEASDGDVVLVSVNAEDAVLRRYRRTGGTSGMVVLQPDNPSYPPIVAAPENVRVIGKVVWVKFKP